MIIQLHYDGVDWCDGEGNEILCGRGVEIVFNHRQHDGTLTLDVLMEPREDWLKVSWKNVAIDPWLLVEPHGVFFEWSWVRAKRLENLGLTSPIWVRKV